MPYLANSVNSRVDTVLTEPPKPVVESSSTNFLDRTILQADGSNWRIYLAVILVAAAVYLACAISPPSLQDDVDAVQAQIARNMITSGDWVTPRLDGVVYLEKPPLIYWLIAASYEVFGVHDWAARIPIAVAAIALCWLTAAFGIWAFGKRAGHGDMCRVVAVHTRADPGRGADSDHCASDLGVATGAG